MDNDWDTLTQDEKIERLQSSVEALQNHATTWNAGVGQVVTEQEALAEQIARVTREWSALQESLGRMIADFNARIVTRTEISDIAWSKALSAIHAEFPRRMRSWFNRWSRYTTTKSSVGGADMLGDVTLKNLIYNHVMKVLERRNLVEVGTWQAASPDSYKNAEDVRYER